MIRLDRVKFEFPLHGSIAQFTSSVGGKMTKSRRGKQAIRAIDNLSITIDTGERVAIYGKNGSGKTTLLRLLAGIYAPTSGVMKSEGAIRSILGLGSGMFGHVNGLENIKLRCALYGISDIETVIEDVVEFSGLGSFLSMPVNNLSAGMKMRLAFALATIGKADILILDEWIGAGDADFRDQASDRMEEFVQKAGTIILSSHNRNLIKRVCDRIILLDRGRLVKDGPIEEFPNFAD